jgi:hypothetical protein
MDEGRQTVFRPSEAIGLVNPVGHEMNNRPNEWNE